MTVFRKTNTFDVFRQCVNYKNESILDFGGNRGNLLTSSNGKIQQKKYTCLDISQSGLDALPAGTKSIHWNRYHPNYNPTGNLEEKFPKIKYHDIVFANSVFTHHKLEEMLFCINALSHKTNRIIFTYIDPDNEKFLKRFQKKYYNLEFDKQDVSYTTDEKGIFWSAFNTDYLKNCFSYYRLESGTTSWFNYIDIQVRPPVVAGMIGY